MMRDGLQVFPSSVLMARQSGNRLLAAKGCAPEWSFQTQTRSLLQGLRSIVAGLIGEARVDAPVATRSRHRRRSSRRTDYRRRRDRASSVARPRAPRRLAPARSVARPLVSSPGARRGCGARSFRARRTDNTSPDPRHPTLALRSSHAGPPAAPEDRWQAINDPSDSCVIEGMYAPRPVS